MDKDKDISEVFDMAKKFCNLIKSKGFKVTNAYLFGSYTKYRSHKDSDIDLAIILKNPGRNLFDEQINLMRIAGKFEDSKIEPHPIDESDFEEGNPFVDEIKRTGIRIV